MTGISDAIMSAENRTFAYDNLNRLVQAGGAFSQSFSYDALGNLLTREGQSYSYNTSKPHAVSHLGGVAAQRFVYDAMGNMTSRGS